MNKGFHDAGVALLAALLVVGGAAQRAIAHGAKLQYDITQAYAITATYDSGEPMVGAQVAIFSPEDPSNPWSQGITNDQGKFFFMPPTAGEWEVQVRQAGHGDIVVIPVSETLSSPPPTARTGAFDGWQKGVMAGSVLWGCVGTALFFSKPYKSR